MKMRFVLMFPLVVCLFSSAGAAFCGPDKPSIVDLANDFKQSVNSEQRLKIANQIRGTKPTKSEEMIRIRQIFSNEKFDGQLFEAVLGAVEQIDDPALDLELINSLKDEKENFQYADIGDLRGKSKGVGHHYPLLLNRGLLGLGIANKDFDEWV